MRKVDNLGCGATKLVEGKLEDWIHETTRARLLNPSSKPGSSGVATNLEQDIANLDQCIVEEQAKPQDERTAGRVIVTDDGMLIFETESDEVNESDEIINGNDKINEDEGSTI